MKALCAYFGVSRAAYYAWRGQVDQVDKDQERMCWVQEAYQASHRIYGYRRIKLWLVALGQRPPELFWIRCDSPGSF